ncbi:transmembrane amino acid transporter protein-domain-containing protein [Leucosporidium creatinivorum]|uniref:Transmembrane amino acid transporter protein-domain-containing protein n=1 Tax=Leucosporidium creatinivorum TaxID=106004 RepID=A0A1Y2FWV9_9BASI|nr:transmembrane amino acid transporter protein-domain-containing protein [Leucosporidium creatinivorum]
MTFLGSKKLNEKEKSSDGEVAMTYGVDESQQVAKADAVFGEVEEGGHDYTNLGWLRASVVLTKAQLGLGVLGIPGVFSTVGMVPGLIMLFAVALMTSYSSYVIGRFKVVHPEVHSIGDAGYLLFGPIGREFLGGVYWLYMVCSAGSGMLSTSIAFNAVSTHGTCTVVFVVVAAIIAAILASIQTLSRVSILGYIGLVSIMTSIIVVCVAVGVQERPALAPAAPALFDLNLKAFGSPTFAEIGNCLGTLVFAYGAVPASFNLVAEMRRPLDFTKTAAVSQSIITAFYVTVGVVVYRYAGDYIASPALGTAGPLMKKICYGIALPALLISSTIFSHLSAKYLFVRALRGTRHLTANSATHWTVWLLTVLTSVVIAFVIAEGVPVFNALIGLIGALFGSIMTLQVMACMWFYDNWQNRKVDRSFSFRALVFWNVFLIVAGTFITGAGTYGAIEEIINGSKGQSFACGDNSNSV